MYKFLLLFNFSNLLRILLFVSVQHYVSHFNNPDKALVVSDHPPDGQATVRLYEENRIKRSSENGYYWQYRGNPILLLGGSFQDNPFNHPNSLQPGSTLENHLDTLIAAGGNYLRNTMSHRDPADPDDPPSNVFAYEQDENGLFDLERFNEEYWDRLDTFLRLCQERGIIVQIEIWETHDYHHDNNEPRTGWINNPFNPENNINYTAEETGLPTDWVDRPHESQEKHPFFRTPPDVDDNSKVLYWQKAFVDKILSIALNYDNVLYVMNNETSAVPEWGEYWVTYVKEKAEQAGKSIEATDMREHQNIMNETHDRFFDQPEVYDFAEISQNNWQNSDLHWDRIQERRQQLSENPRPLNNTKIYGADDFEHTGGDQAGVERFWRNLIGGAASQRFHRPPFGIGLDNRAQANLKSARMLADKVDFFSSNPENELLTNREVNEAFATMNKGISYAVYFPDSGSVDIDLTSISGDVVLTWLDIENSEWLESDTISPDVHYTLKTPGHGGWVAVLINKEAASNDEPLPVEPVSGFDISAIYPNPFSAEAVFMLRLESTQVVRMVIYNALGQKVGLLYQGTLDENVNHSFALQAENLSSGIYIIHITGEDFSTSVKAALIR